MTSRSLRTCVQVLTLTLASFAAQADVLDYEYDALGRLEAVKCCANHFVIG
jgi:hypothetical protein